jgi:hypothetical protein
MRFSRHEEQRRPAQRGLAHRAGAAARRYLPDAPLDSAWPDVTKHIEKLIILIIFISLLPSIIGCPKSRMAKSNEEPAS